ncbi:hypothetical protein [Phenylobacterium sp.]|uniref:hypothetical protein n=1 Tax=Phenylobacterium sp. TaxID=1871053 RepID=UPI00273407E0|nr:hypothetical protein [Phenylobacterium sp.]MDP3852582.1 hypothetical protein [Phenylobacterium sp.]
MPNPRILGLLLALAIPTAASAASGARSPVEAAFGNTVVSTYPDGRTGLLWLKRDGTYTAKGRRRTDSIGRWTMRGPRVCLKQARPVRVPMSYCTLIPKNAVGAVWDAKAVTGEAIRVKIVRGRVS